MLISSGLDYCFSLIWYVLMKSNDICTTQSTRSSFFFHVRVFQLASLCFLLYNDSTSHISQQQALLKTNLKDKTNSNIFECIYDTTLFYRIFCFGFVLIQLTFLCVPECMFLKESCIIEIPLGLLRTRFNKTSRFGQYFQNTVRCFEVQRVFFFHQMMNRSFH